MFSWSILASYVVLGALHLLGHGVLSEFLLWDPCCLGHITVSFQFSQLIELLDVYHDLDRTHQYSITPDPTVIDTPHYRRWSCRGRVNHCAQNLSFVASSSFARPAQYDMPGKWARLSTKKSNPILSQNDLQSSLAPKPTNASQLRNISSANARLDYYRMCFWSRLGHCSINQLSDTSLACRTHHELGETIRYFR